MSVQPFFRFSESNVFYIRYIYMYKYSGDVIRTHGWPSTFLQIFLIIYSTLIYFSIVIKPYLSVPLYYFKSQLIDKLLHSNEINGCVKTIKLKMDQTKPVPFTLRSQVRAPYREKYLTYRFVASPDVCVRDLYGVFYVGLCSCD